MSRLIGTKERCEECIFKRLHLEKQSWSGAHLDRSMTSSSTCALRLRRSSNTLQLCSRRRTGKCFTFRKSLRTDSKPWKTTPRFLTKCRKSSLLPMRGESAGTTLLLEWNGHRGSGLSSRETEIILISFHENGQKALKLSDIQKEIVPLTEGQ